MYNFYEDFVANSFESPENFIEKDYIKSIEDYFNYYFNDDALTYSLFKYLQDFRDSDHFFVDDLEEYCREENNNITHAQFSKALKNLTKIKLIDPSEYNDFYYFYDEGMEFLENLDE